MYTFEQRKEIVLKNVKENMEYKNLVFYCGYTIEHYIDINEENFITDLTIKINYNNFLSPGVNYVISDHFNLFDSLKLNELVKLIRYSKFLVFMHKYALENCFTKDQLKLAHREYYYKFGDCQSTLAQLMLK